MANKDTVKPWFKAGAYPTQAQFWQKIDWLRWKDEQLTIAEITGLQGILNTLAAGMGIGGGNAVVVQIHTAGATVNVNDDTTWLIINPATTIANLLFIFPINPTHGQRLDVSAGGVMASWSLVVAHLIMELSGGQTLAQATFPEEILEGETISFQFNLSNNKWYRL